MTTIHRIQTNQRMSQVVVVDNLAFVAGQLADSGNVDVRQQTREILHKIDALLASTGTSKATIVNASIWLTSPEDFGAFNAVWDAWVPAGDAPARATVASSLMKPGCNVEIAVIAHVSRPMAEA